VAAHATHQRLDDEQVQLGDRAKPLARTLMIAAVIGLVVSAGLGLVAGDRFKGFFHAYLAAYGFFVSLGLGAIFFVVVQHLTKAGWSVNVRRIAEALASTMPAIAVLSIPILVSVALYNGDLYPWAKHLNAGHGHHAAPHDEHAADTDHAEKAAGQQHPAADASGHAEAAEPDAGKQVSTKEHASKLSGQQMTPAEIEHHTAEKRHYLNLPFFFIRMAIYLGAWSLIGLWYWRNSVAQDADGDLSRTEKMERFAPMAAIVTMLTLSFGAVDLLMSLDPIWYSTIFGVYYFAGAAISIMAFMAITLHLLQAAGFLRNSVKVDHYHDLGKFLFGFTFFYGYIAFSQFMLMWYGNIPEENFWWQRHGGTTVSTDVTIWSFVLIALLFGKILIPFAGLLSRHVKRNKQGLIFWSVWQLAFCALDIFWIVMPQMGKSFNVMTVLMYLAAFVGIGGIMVSLFLTRLSAHSLRPLRDPRLHESTGFINV
jgi:hypothetical protein